MKEPRFDVILRVLRSEQPVRPLLAYELRGPVVQLLGSGASDPTWQATPGLLAMAMVKALAAAERTAEEKDTLVGSQPTGTPSTAHALVLGRDQHDFVGTCQCGRPIGRTPQGRPLDGLVGLWEQHAAQADPDAAWADALTALPSSIGAS